ncbi:hypothetical protein MPL3356_490031 [Mesorhizobium plurifarium]|uniref:Uncharacterized protein n=1 Tax=Mesorhizobium plurifarium TaxID=69974 RepID=A0A090E5S5_MESPL|nr:hypothetical protein MPL3356_490031 [Mesorhizobium plurifarium]
MPYTHYLSRPRDASRSYGERVRITRLLDFTRARSVTKIEHLQYKQEFMLSYLEAE